MVDRGFILRIPRFKYMNEEGEQMSIDCPRCGKLVTFIPFGYGHVAICCGVVLASLSGAKPQAGEYLSKDLTLVRQ
jgi:hypothetical protein